MLNAPYMLWSVLFIVAPLIMVGYYAFTDADGNFTWNNITQIGDYTTTFILSISYGAVATVICLLIAYPFAYALAQTKASFQRVATMLVMLPMWMSFLIRTYSWITILGESGVINSFLGLFGIDPIRMLNTGGAVILGMVYNFLPFMVLPIFNSLSKMDNDLINAARDLGANSFQVFMKVIFPLSLPGVVSGITMVFMPAVTTFAISRLLGGGKFMLIGDLIEQQFTVVGDWNFGSAISIFMMIIILISMAVMSRFEDESDKEGGGLLF
jgi:spermidine/putrescine transport system permease protein